MSDNPPRAARLIEPGHEGRLVALPSDHNPPFIEDLARLPYELPDTDIPFAYARRSFTYIGMDSEVPVYLLESVAYWASTDKRTYKVNLRPQPLTPETP